MMAIKSGLAVVLAILILGSPSRVQAQTFGYFGDLGPVHWGDLSPDWLTCKVGRMQSPVDFGHPSHHPPVSHRRLNIDRYRYLGSLTTPPCSEGVQRIVMTEPVTRVF